MLVPYQGSTELKCKLTMLYDFFKNENVAMFSRSRAEVKYSVRNKPHRYENIKETIACTGNYSLLLGFCNIMVICEKAEICDSPSSIMESV